MLSVTKPSDIQEQLYQLVRHIPAGRVASYGWLGNQLGISPRVVGWLLHRNPDSDLTPCHRVVRVDGSLASGYAFGGLDVQRQLLVKEGVQFRDGRVVRACFVDSTSD